MNTMSETLEDTRGHMAKLDFIVDDVVKGETEVKNQVQTLTKKFDAKVSTFQGPTKLRTQLSLLHEAFNSLQKN